MGVVSHPRLIQLVQRDILAGTTNNGGHQEEDAGNEG